MGKMKKILLAVLTLGCTLSFAFACGSKGGETGNSSEQSQSSSVFESEESSSAESDESSESVHICITEGDNKNYVGYTYGARHFNRTCTAHFDKIEWQKRVAEILATMENTAPQPDITAEPADTRRRFFNFFGLPKNENR